MSKDQLSGNPVVVLGMFRSGTSCLASCLARLGVFLGNEEAFFPPDQYNPGGYFELLPLIDVSNRLLDLLGNSSARLRPFPEDWQSVPGIDPYVHRIESILVSQFRKQRLWGWKSPQTSVLLPIYKEILDRHQAEPVYAISVRSPVDVARSTRGSAYLPTMPSRLIGLWLHYTLSSLVETIGAKRCVIKYESFLEDPAAQLRPLATLCPDFAPESSAWQSLDGIVNPDLRHFAHPDEALDEWPPIVRATEMLCRQLSVDPDKLMRGIYDAEIRSLWEQWQLMSAVGILRPAEYPRGKTSAVWNVGGSEKRYDSPFIPVEGWQTIRIPIHSEWPGKAALDLYQTPGIVRIRRAEWVLAGSKRNAEFVPTANGRIAHDEGMLKLRVLGPYPLEVTIPRNCAEGTLELELTIDTDPKATTEIITGLREELAQSRDAVKLGDRKK